MIYSDYFKTVKICFLKGLVSVSVYIRNLDQNLENNGRGFFLIALQTISSLPDKITLESKRKIQNYCFLTVSTRKKSKMFSEALGEM